jgi:hypothetical protein
MIVKRILMATLFFSGHFPDAGDYIAQSIRPIQKHALADLIQIEADPRLNAIGSPHAWLGAAVIEDLV